MIGLIAAVSPEWVIGVGGKLPWSYPADMKRFMRVTTGTTVIMGRLTFESVGKALPRRRNIVVTRARIDVPDIETFATVDDAIRAVSGGPVGGDVWFIGGSRVYEEGMKHADVIDLTLVPDHVDVVGSAARFPPIDARDWEREAETEFEGDARLKHVIYRRRR